MIVFKYKAESISTDGTLVKRPVADVFLQAASGEWIKFHPYIDSGADVTLIPLSLGKLLGSSARGKKVETIGGISGGVPIIYIKNPMQIGTFTFESHIGWTQIEDVPALLGRADVFDQFDVNFKQKDSVIIFKKR